MTEYFSIFCSIHSSPSCYLNVHYFKGRSSLLTIQGHQGISWSIKSE